MSTKLFGFDSSTFIPAADFSAQQSDKGLWEGSQTFSIARSAWDFFTGSTTLIVGTPATAFDSNLPSFWSFLTLQRVETENVTGGFAKVRIFYTGYYSFNQNVDPEAGVPTTYNLAGTLEEVPLMEHPKVTALADIEITQLEQIVEGNLSWDGTNVLTKDNDGEFTKSAKVQNITTTDGQAFAALLVNGEATYKRPSFSWTKTYESTDALPAADMNDLGHISVPDGDPPTPNGSRDWMMVSADQTQTASTEPVYSIQISWLLSEREGWNSDLYDT